MPRSLVSIPVGVDITEKGGPITTFFRQAWQSLRDGFQLAATVATVGILATAPANAAMATTTLYTTLDAGLYRVSWYVRKVVADGVSSSLTVTIGWTEGGVALVDSGAAITNDSVTTGQQSGSFMKQVDANANITAAVAYASNTPGNMEYMRQFTVERMA